MFQFTHPGRGATWLIYSTLLYPSVSIHAPREGCDLRLLHKGVVWEVSIHAPREGCDGLLPIGMRYEDVSIHAPREGCDNILDLELSYDKRFNSRTPGGVRPHRGLD